MSEKLREALSNADIMSMLQKAGFTDYELEALTITSWKDSIDINKPSAALQSFVELVRAYKAALAEPEFCEWKVVSNGGWWIDCKGATRLFNKGDYCSKCGKPIKEVKEPK